MPRAKSPSLKDPELYDALRCSGRVHRSTVGRRGGKAGDYEDWTVVERHKKAMGIGLSGDSKLRKNELIEALRNS